MKIWRIPDQAIRLAVLFAIAGAALVFARIWFVPETFGELGHYRAASIDTILGQEIRYAGWQTCGECHTDLTEAKSRSFHRTLSCEVCHGPAADHANDPTSVLPDVPRARGEACLYCHEYLSSRPTGFPQILERLHNPMEPCITCHDPHDPTPPETPEQCSACHAQIARTKAISHHHRVDCVTCHDTPAAHSESPRANLPHKPTDRSFCVRCHGSDSTVADAPRVDPAAHGGTYLCWQCHYPHFPGS